MAWGLDDHGLLPGRLEAFTQNPDVLFMVANDAAGEGINLQRAHLMVNYDLPWNPSRPPRYLIGYDFGEPVFAQTATTFSLRNLLASAGDPL